MDDKTIMNTILSNVKGVCGLMMHGSIESGTPNVHSAFKTGLNDALEMQNKIYNKMVEKGWYTNQPVEPQKIQQTKQKFSSNNG
ncbi:MAG: spore coat protein [Epulopiscium sp.]|nr:spore coat protein [Candidatus Epulonipiscium sp.]